MKVQYLGDVNDYCKFALLRLLARTGSFKIGVCWMLTESDQVLRGANRKYLQEIGDWRSKPDLVVSDHGAKFTFNAMLA